MKALFKRFVRWLARRELRAAESRLDDALREAEAARVYEITQARLDEQGKAAGRALQQGMAAKMAESMAYAAGQVSGPQEMLDQMDRIVGERTGNQPDFVTPEDIARARKGWLH